MRSTYRTLAYLIATVVAVQAASVALAFFMIIVEVEDVGAITSSYDYESNAGVLIHRYGAGVITLAAIALLVVAFLTKVDGAVRRAVIVLGLVVLQIALVIAAFSTPWAGALHGANAIAMFAAAAWAGHAVMRGAETSERTTASVAA